VLTGAQAFPGTTSAIAGDPEVVFVDGTYHLWFSGFGCTGVNCATVTDRGVSYATSTDGITWTIVAAPVKSLLRASADDTTGGQRPSVLYDAAHCKWEMWMTNDLPADTASQPVLDNTAGVWKAESLDGKSWSVFFTGQRDLAWNAAAPATGERLGLSAGADVAQSATGRAMIYVGFDDQSVPAGYTLPGNPSGTVSGVKLIGSAFHIEYSASPTGITCAIVIAGSASSSGSRSCHARAMPMNTCGRRADRSTCPSAPTTSRTITPGSGKKPVSQRWNARFARICAHTS
jgi:hypothetical protein